eukprot:4518385-Pleurochrysis_carterae.AAC.1
MDTRLSIRRKRIARALVLVRVRAWLLREGRLRTHTGAHVWPRVRNSRAKLLCAYELARARA